jgi:L-serine dehydratase
MVSISIFEIIKVGIGPSSSHTMGPWTAANMFLEELEAKKSLDLVDHIYVNLYGSLALTGVGHGTDIAIIMGLAGFNFKTFDPAYLDEIVAEIKDRKSITLPSGHSYTFDPSVDILFHKRIKLPFHANGMEIIARLRDGIEISKKYYSVGGGFVATEEENTIEDKAITTKYPCHTAKQISNYCKQFSMSVSDLVMINELAWANMQQIKQQCSQLWEEIKACIYRGIHKEGLLPGDLQVKRRAHGLNLSLLENQTYSSFDEWISCIRSKGAHFKLTNKWISCFALAVNEENASFGRIVTAPTNGAAGVIPAVLMYAYIFEEISHHQIIRFLLTAGEIGTIFKKNATISAAMGGCQAEIGVSSSMAAAGLTDCLGGSPEQTLMAAEIAMEHHLGLTCDPVGGLVQIPCIERNSMGAIKAITASNLAMESDPSSARVSLDDVIKTMWETAKDMHVNYKETSEGGLAVNIPVNVVEC